MIADGINKLMCNGYNSDVINAMRSCYEQWKEQPMDHVAPMASSSYSVNDKCEAVFGHLVDNVSYQLDPEGYQYIKSPARLLKDGCGDCKSLTMYICCCLYCLGVKHKMRFVNFDGGNQYTHVYAVAIDEGGNEIILDACEKDEDGMTLYDYARPYSKKKDIIYNE